VRAERAVPIEYHLVSALRHAPAPMPLGLLGLLAHVSGTEHQLIETLISARPACDVLTSMLVVASTNAFGLGAKLAASASVIDARAQPAAHGRLVRAAAQQFSGACFYAMLGWSCTADDELQMRGKFANKLLDFAHGAQEQLPRSAGWLADADMPWLVAMMNARPGLQLSARLAGIIRDRMDAEGRRAMTP
jgi:hypothetical protein